MRKYLSSLIIFTALLASFAGLALPARAQTRAIPPEAKVGVIQVGVFPAAIINGRNVRFGAGARIMNEKNQIVLPASISGGEYQIAYTADFQGLLKIVWLVSDSEAVALRASRSNTQR